MSQVIIQLTFKGINTSCLNNIIGQAIPVIHNPTWSSYLVFIPGAASTRESSSWTSVHPIFRASERPIFRASNIIRPRTPFHPGPPERTNTIRPRTPDHPTPRCPRAPPSGMASRERRTSVHKCSHRVIPHPLQLILERVNRCGVDTSLVELVPAVNHSFTEEVLPKIAATPVLN
jgi:hypothetical protein